MAKQTQTWLPDAGLYYYKARIYSPTLGRFLQTDPIGYEDQYNLYAYVGNDPVNKIDPTGLEGVLTINAGETHVWISYQHDGSDEVTTYGRWARGYGDVQTSGVHENVEKRLGYKPIARRQKRLSNKEERVFYESLALEKENESWTYWCNCTHFAEGIWSEVTGEKFTDNWGFEQPSGTIEDIQNLNGGVNIPPKIPVVPLEEYEDTGEFKKDESHP